MFIRFNNTYAKLPENFYTRIKPLTVKNPQLVHFNYILAKELNIDVEKTDNQEIAAIFAGNKILAGAEPMALVYAGHQFGHFVPRLGDGRALLLGEVLDKNNKLRDLQLKGSGPTSYSRGGDGKAALGPMVREYIVSEAMHALRIKTTRCLALVTTGEEVYRETSLPGAILTRVALSHVRVGTFEYFAAQNDVYSLKLLADYVIQRLYPNAAFASNPYIALLEYIIEAQASLIVDWMRVGFIHGVMNTDNLALSGETIDYGPCAFMDEYKSDKVFSSIDYYGRYAFDKQASLCYWNLIQFAQALGLILDTNTEQSLKILYNTVTSFQSIFTTKYLTMMGQKIGIIKPETQDRDLIESLLDIMQKDSLDYTLTFRYLCYTANNAAWPYLETYSPSEKLKAWIKDWQVRVQSQSEPIESITSLMFSLNPAFIPRNHQIEKIIQSIKMGDDYYLQMDKMLNVLSNPYLEQKDNIEYMHGPAPQERVTQTFCGT